MSNKQTDHSKQITENDIAIKVEGVSKTFKLPHEKQTSLKGLFLSSFKKKSFEKQEALKNVSFEVKKGEFFGIVGRNGSGKSTLLKMMAGIYQPSKGQVKVNGKLIPFIELGVGFNPELSGRDNVFLNGALLGFNRKQMSAMYDEIVEFAELERFMDQKLKNYSSGMQVRLAFSIAIRAKGDILLLDEVLAVGDYNFQKKCIRVFHKLKEEKKTIILVSHDTNQVERFCDRAMVVGQGELKYVGNPTQSVAIYDELNRGGNTEEAASRKLKVTKSPEVQPSNDYKPITINVPVSAQEINIMMPFIQTVGLPDDTVVAVTLEDENAHTIYAYATDQDNREISLNNKGESNITFTITNVFPGGTYFVDAGFFSRDRAITYLKLENLARIQCEGLPKKEWLIRAPTRLKIN